MANDPGPFSIGGRPVSLERLAYATTVLMSVLVVLGIGWLSPLDARSTIELLL